MDNIYNCTSKAGTVLPQQLQELWRHLIFMTCILLFSNYATAQITVDGDPSDWNNVYTNNTIVVKNLVRDANDTNDDQFTGGSQDPDLISEWSWVNGNTNDKGDISNAGAALIGCNLYFFGDRTAINGDAQIGFWFFKGQVSPSGTGTTNSSFTGEHQDGDLLILSNFTNGGGTPTVRVYEWVGSGGSDGSLNLLTTATSSGAVNTTSYSVPNVTYEGDTWSYAAKVGPAGIYPTGAFFEGTVNLCTLYGAQNAPCFSSFLLETRNSQSTSASLQDFAAGGFDVTPIKYTLTGSSFCASNASTGSINLSDSQLGVSYQLLNESDVPVQTPKNGTGAALTWTNISPGTGYRVVANRSGFNCPTYTDRVDVISFPAVIVEAGGPDTRCQSPTAQIISLTGASVTGGASNGTWSILSSNPTNASNILTNNTLAAGSLTVAANYTGVITLQLTSPDPAGPCPAVTDTRIIYINSAATVEAGEPIAVCQSSTAQNVALTGASATGGTATWSIQSATPTNAGISLSDNTLAAGSLRVPANYTGAVVVRLSVADPDGNGPCVAVNDDRTITIYPGVTVEAGGPDNVCQSANPAAITLTGATIGGGAATGAWSIVTGGGSLSTTLPVANPAIVTYTPAPNYFGEVILRLTTNDPTGPCTDRNDTRIINVYRAAIVNAGGPYQVPCAVNGGVRQVTLVPVISGGATSVTWIVPAGMGAVTGNVYTPSATAITAGAPVILTAMTNDPVGPCPAVSANATVTFATCNPFEGCTLGYWKNHTDRWCDAYKANPTYGSVFVNAPAELTNLTLLQVLNLGGGGIYNLGRQSVAALLNICSPAVNYNSAYPTTTSLITAVNAAFRAGGTAPGTLASRLDTYNNAGCPLGGTPATTSAASKKSPNSGELLVEGVGTALSAYPNPYTNKSTIEFTLQEGGDYTLVLYDVKGSVVRSISAGKAIPGKVYSFEIGNNNMPEGIYIARLSTDKLNKVLRISLRR